MQIACLGECMIELSGQPVQKRYGGDTLNTAVYMARALHGKPHRVHYMTALGEDQLSQFMRSAWQAEGICIDSVASVPGKLPGLYMVDVDAKGERSFLYWRNDSAARHYFASAIPFEELWSQHGIDALYLSGISLALFSDEGRARLTEALANFKRSGGRLWFDNNFRANLWTAERARAAHEQVLALTDVAMLTLDDEQKLYGEHNASEAIARTLQLGCSEVVIKRGELSCMLGNGKALLEIPAIADVKVVDTCAAGDSFAAAYLASRICGTSMAVATANAHRLSSTVIGFPGAIIPQAAMPALQLEHGETDFTALHTPVL